MEKDIKVSEIQQYYNNCKDGLLVHGTVSTVVDDVLKDGLLIKAKDHPTVLSSIGGFLKDGTPLTEYEWCEPRKDGENVAIVIQVPTEILESIKEKGLPLSQKNIFDEICEEVELEVPDNEETRAEYEEKLNSEKNSNGLRFITEGLAGDKFSERGMKPGTKYKKWAIPSKYICAITSSNKVYYAAEEVKEFIKKLPKDQEVKIPLDLNITDDLDW